MQKATKTMALGALAFIFAGIVARFAVLNFAHKDPELVYYEPFKNSLYRLIAENNVSHMFASRADLDVLREEFAFLKTASPREKVLQLIAWIDQNTKRDEVFSIRALDVYQARSGGCEVHALAVGVLAAFEMRARWISNVKSSHGFGYLEVYLDDQWELFRLRSGREDPSLHTSAWELYRTSEPGLSIRNFWWKPAQSWRSWKDAVYPALFPFANVKEHPEIEPMLRSDQGIHLRYRLLNPYEYAYGYYQAADGPWTLEGTVMEKFLQERTRDQWRRRTSVLLNLFGATTYQD